MDELAASLHSLGITLPSPAYIAGAIAFGIVGLIAWRYGRKHEQRRTLWLGVALMFYPYIVPNTWLMYAVGGVLCLLLWLWRE